MSALPPKADIRLAHRHVCQGPISDNCGFSSARPNAPRSECEPSKTRPILQALFAVLQHLHLLQRDEAAGHHAIEYRQELVDLRLRVYNLDDDGKVVRQSKYLGCVKAARMTEADCAAKYGCAAEMHAAGLQHDGLIQRLMLE